MKTTAFFRGEPMSTLDEVENKFDTYFPPCYTGYIRLLTVRDVGQPYFKPGWYGVFYSDGQLVNSTIDRAQALEFANKEGIVTYYAN